MIIGFWETQIEKKIEKRMKKKKNRNKIRSRRTKKPKTTWKSVRNVKTGYEMFDDYFDDHFNEVHEEDVFYQDDSDDVFWFWTPGKKEEENVFLTWKFKQSIYRWIEK